MTNWDMLNQRTLWLALGILWPHSLLLLSSPSCLSQNLHCYNHSSLTASLLVAMWELVLCIPVKQRSGPSVGLWVWQWAFFLHDILLCLAMGQSSRIFRISSFWRLPVLECWVRIMVLMPSFYNWHFPWLPLASSFLIICAVFWGFSKEKKKRETYNIPA